MGWRTFSTTEETALPRIKSEDDADRVFFDSQGTVHKELVQEGCTLNAEHYAGVLDRLISRIRRIRPALYLTRDFFLLHDNAPALSAAKILKFLTQKQVTTLNQPPYSPGLSPPRLLPVPEGEAAAEGCKI